MVGAADPQEHQRDECSDDEAEVDHSVGEPDEVSVTLTAGQQVRGLCGGGGATGVLTTDGDTQEESVSGQRCEEATGVGVRGAFTPSTSAQDGEQDQHGCTEQH